MRKIVCLCVGGWLCVRVKGHVIKILNGENMSFANNHSSTQSTNQDAASIKLTNILVENEYQSIQVKGARFAI
jgi:hypothetical protein